MHSWHRFCTPRPAGDNGGPYASSSMRCYRETIVEHQPGHRRNSRESAPLATRIYTCIYISRARVCVFRVHKVSFRAAVYTRCVPRILVPASTRRKPLAEVNTQRVLFQASCSYGVGVVLRIRDKEKRFFEFSRAFSSFLSVLRQASYKGSPETIASFN